MSVKGDNYLRPFRGRGDDFEVLWQKFLVLCTLQKQDTDIKKMSVLPLFLDGDAFQVFTQMSADDQKKPDEVQKRLQGAFSMTRAQAYRLFSDRVLREDESADAYVADLKRLLALSGHPVKDSKDQILVEQLIRGLPVDFGRQVRLALAGKEAEVVVIVDQIRTLRACEADCRHVQQATVAFVGGDDRTARDRAVELYVSSVANLATISATALVSQVSVLRSRVTTSWYVTSVMEWATQRHDARSALLG